MSLDPKKQWGLDQKNLLLHQRSARKAFREVLDLLKPITMQVKDLFPGSDVAARRRRSMAWGELLKQVPDARAIMTPFIGTEAEIGDEAGSLWGAAVKLLRGVSLGVKKINETLSALDDLTMRGFQASSWRRRSRRSGRRYLRSSGGSYPRTSWWRWTRTATSPA